jgi:catechol 2,3-dioxygenase-like lactoylglutathione lyase family enzyme
MFVLEHIGLAANDPRALKDWYERTLGATVAFAMNQTPPAFLLNLGGGMMIELYQAGSRSEIVSDNRLAGWRHIALKVASIEQARERLEKAGVVFSDPVKPAGGGGRVLFFKDPEGNLLHLVERLPSGFQ